MLTLLFITAAIAHPVTNAYSDYPNASVCQTGQHTSIRTKERKGAVRRHDENPLLALHCLTPVQAFGWNRASVIAYIIFFVVLWCILFMWILFSISANCYQFGYSMCFWEVMIDVRVNIVARIVISAAARGTNKDMKDVYCFLASFLNDWSSLTWEKTRFCFFKQDHTLVDIFPFQTKS